MEMTFEQGEQIISLLTTLRMVGWICEVAVVSSATSMVFLVCKR